MAGSKIILVSGRADAMDAPPGQAPGTQALIRSSHATGFHPGVPRWARPGRLERENIRLRTFPYAGSTFGRPLVVSIAAGRGRMHRTNGPSNTLRLDSTQEWMTDRQH